VFVCATNRAGQADKIIPITKKAGNFEYITEPPFVSEIKLIRPDKILYKTFLYNPYYKRDSGKLITAPARSIYKCNFPQFTPNHYSSQEKLMVFSFWYRLGKGDRQMSIREGRALAGERRSVGTALPAGTALCLTRLRLTWTSRNINSLNGGFGIGELGR
jgi:hypothetical protein